MNNNSISNLNKRKLDKIQTINRIREDIRRKQEMIKILDTLTYPELK